MKLWTADPNCPICKGKGTYEESYFDVGDVKTHWTKHRCYDCYIKALVAAKQGFAVYGPVSTMIFEKSEQNERQWKQYNIVAGQSLWSDQIWDTDALEQFAFWVIEQRG